MLAHGESGYTENCRKIVEVTHALAAGIRAIKGLKLMCEPGSSVVSWTSDVFDVNALGGPLVDVSASFLHRFLKYGLVFGFAEEALEHQCAAVPAQHAHVCHHGAHC